MTKQCSECVSGVCQPCVRCVSASPKAKIRGQPQTQNPRPARNQGGTHPPPRNTFCEKWCGAHFFYDASDEKPVSPCVGRVIKCYFRGCFVRKACVGPQRNCYDLRPCYDCFARSIKRNACVRSPAGACYDLTPPLVTRGSGKPNLLVIIP